MLLGATMTAGNAGVLLSIAVAATIQSLTGFAFGLIFMGLVTAAGLLPIPVAANAITLISILQAGLYLRQHHHHLQWHGLSVLAVPMLVGVGLGIACLAWWSASAVGILRPLLGLVIMGAAVAFVWPKQSQAHDSGALTMASTATLAGWLGGVFSTAGPPLVYLLYRQPWSLERIKATLTLLFGVSQLLRLCLVMATGHFTVESTAWAAAAFPLLLGVGWWHTRYPPRLSRRILERVVGTLLFLAGLSLVLR